jgi:hypothetical protein
MVKRVMEPWHLIRRVKYRFFKEVGVISLPGPVAAANLFGIGQVVCVNILRGIYDSSQLWIVVLTRNLLRGNGNR